VAVATAGGVPMGGVLRPAEPDTASPVFYVAALGDWMSAPLQRIQIIKGWIGADGKTHEKVRDIACTGGLEVDPTTLRCPDNGASVDLTSCKPTGDTGPTSIRRRAPSTTSASSRTRPAAGRPTTPCVLGGSPIRAPPRPCASGSGHRRSGSTPRSVPRVGRLPKRRKSRRLAHRPRPRRIGGESGPPSSATETNASSFPISARNSPSPVPIRRYPSPKTPRKRGVFWDGHR
jgi:hypothetical protein